ncbi:hypothetical protein [Streptacidiphilus cavernicola]|uniref:Uncharacterized protein n=1 Tax=Streptacidiphilus cavernicola TaxID=3342716 RepID=A0ABV6VYD7_9ACTN
MIQMPESPPEDRLLKAAEVWAAVGRIVDYSWSAEARDWAEQDAEGRAGHIFEDLAQVRYYLARRQLSQQGGKLAFRV